MKLTLQRRPSHAGCTIGELSIDGVHECYTLEDTVREIPGAPIEKWKVQNQTAIPAGIYRVITDLSSRFHRIMLHIVAVPGFDGIRIHSGNTAADTDGCILVGTQVAPDSRSVIFSATALAALQPKVQAALDAGEVVSLEILTAPQSTT